MHTLQLINGRYETLAIIAERVTATVYRGRDTQTDDRVAIQRFKSDLLSHNPQLIERFMCEGEALGRLNHPNIVKVLAAVVQNEQASVVMEYVAGGSLADLLG